MNNSYYFSHDMNTRSDQKIQRLIAKHGFAGYGYFWAIIEDLYLNANALRTQYDVIAFALHTSEDVVKSIVNDFDLFVVDGDFFGSLSIQRRMDEREAKSVKASESARIRWSKKQSDANAMRRQCEGNAIKERKGKKKEYIEGVLVESVEEAPQTSIPNSDSKQDNQGLTPKQPSSSSQSFTPPPPPPKQPQNLIDFTKAFSPYPGTKGKSYDDLFISFSKYCKEKRLSIPDSIKDLAVAVADYREWYKRELLKKQSDPRYFVPSHKNGSTFINQGTWRNKAWEGEEIKVPLLPQKQTPREAEIPIIES